MSRVADSGGSVLGGNYPRKWVNFGRSSTGGGNDGAIIANFLAITLSLCLAGLAIAAGGTVAPLVGVVAAYLSYANMKNFVDFVEDMPADCPPEIQFKILMDKLFVNLAATVLFAMIGFGFVSANATAVSINNTVGEAVKTLAGYVIFDTFFDNIGVSSGACK
jgi:hypothetical protein